MSAFVGDWNDELSTHDVPSLDQFMVERLGIDELAQAIAEIVMNGVECADDRMNARPLEKVSPHAISWPSAWSGAPSFRRTPNPQVSSVVLRVIRVLAVPSVWVEFQPRAKSYHFRVLPSIASSAARLSPSRKSVATAAVSPPFLKRTATSCLYASPSTSVPSHFSA